MYATTGSGAITQSLRFECGETRNEDWCKSENGFRKHQTEFIQTETVHCEGFDIVIDRERKGTKVEYRLDVLFHEASFDGRSREEVMEQFEEWLDSKVNQEER
jgi:hypothetical protein